MLGRKIYNNFEALIDYCKENLKDFSKINKNSIIKIYSEIIYKKNIKFYNMQDNEFFSSFDFNVLKDINEQYYEKLDNLVRSILIDYSLFYEELTISTSDKNIILTMYASENKNLSRNIFSKNQKIKNKFIQLMRKKDLEGAALEMLKKKYERTKNYRKSEKIEKIDNTIKIIKENYKYEKLSNIHIEVQDILSKTPTYRELKKEIKEFIVEETKNNFLIPEDSMINLSKYLTDEIFLRVKNKEHYVEGYEGYVTAEELENFDKELKKYQTKQLLPKLIKLHEKNSEKAYKDFFDKYI